MPTTIDQLDDLSLLRIFDELSIGDLFRAGRVCVWWNAIRSKSANGRKELTLLVGRDAQKYIDEALFRVPERANRLDNNGDPLIPLKSDDPIQVESLSVEFVRFLYENLPNLSTLIICCQIKDKLGSVPLLLKQFASTGQLRTLKLFTYSMDEPLVNALNSIETLKNLQLSFIKLKLEKLDLPILGQLEEIDIFGPEYFSFQSLMYSILRYGPQNPELRSIRSDFSVSHFDWMLSLRPQFASRFTHLHIHLVDSFGPLGGLLARLHGVMEDPFVLRLDEMCLHFHNLTSLELSKHREIRPLTSTELFISLSHFHNLLSLTIDTTIVNSIPSVAEVSRNIPTLPSVRMLTFKIKNLEHRKFSNLNLPHFFPNVETVRLIRAAQSECRDCRLQCNLKFDKLYNFPVGFYLMFCTLRVTRNLTKCQQLKSVCAKLGDSYTKWSVKEIKKFTENEFDYFSKEINESLNSSKNEDKDIFDFELMKNLDSDSVRSEYEVAGAWYRKLADE